MIYNVSGFPCSDELYHYGILGQKWGVRRYQNSDGTLTSAGKERYYVTKSLGERIADHVRASREQKREKYVKDKPWLMSDDELKTRLNRINMERQYLSALRDVQASNSEGRVRKMLQDLSEKSIRTISEKSIEAVANKLATQERIKNERKYQKAMTVQRINDETAFNKRMAVEAAKNKIAIDKYIDAASKKAARNDISTKIYNDAKKNYAKYTEDELTKLSKRYKTFKDMENHYYGTSLGNITISTFSNSSGKNGKKGGNN